MEEFRKLPAPSFWLLAVSFQTSALRLTDGRRAPGMTRRTYVSVNAIITNGNLNRRCGVSFDESSNRGRRSPDALCLF